MPSHIHSCHQRLIDAGELRRMSDIYAYYRDKAGNLALTDKNHVMYEYGNQAITAKQRDYISKGNRKAFWKARQAVGDPVASVAIPILSDTWINGKVANWLTGLRHDPEKSNQLGVDLMIEHAKAVTKDIEACTGNVPGLLSPEQVAGYHHRVFSKHGIGSWMLGSDGSWLFGGTLMNVPAPLYRMIWCQACDFIGAGVGAN